MWKELCVGGMVVRCLNRMGLYQQLKLNSLSESIDIKTIDISR